MAKLTLFRRKEPMKNGKFRVNIRLTHKHDKIIQSTNYVCTDKDTDSERIVVSPRITAPIYDSFLKKWQDKLDKLEATGEIEEMDVRSIMEYISNDGSDTPDIRKIDFILYINEHYEQCVADGRKNSGMNFLAVGNSIIAFSGKRKIMVNEITINFVERFVAYLQKEHTVITMNHGKPCKVKKSGLNNQSINNRIKDFKTLFNAMKKKYSDPLTGEEYIRINPFKFWKPLIVSNSGGYRATDSDTIRALYELNDLTDGERFGRDMFILSFCLLGINATDLYDLKVSDYKDGRISYCRNKTKGRRSDEAFISVEVLPIAKELLKRYIPKRPLSLLNLSEKYSNVDNLSRAINRGLKSLYLRNIGIPKLTYYSARHTWATIARNECGISREDIDAALNHTSEDLKMADKYIKKDFSANDRNNRKVLEYVFRKEENCDKVK